MSAPQGNETARRVQERLQEWARQVPGFESTNVRIGLYTARFYLGPAAQDEERLFWLALTVGFWVWLDDRSDQQLAGAPGPWLALTQALEGRGEAPRDCLEHTVLRRMEEGLAPLARDPADLTRWRTSVAWVLEGVRLEEESSRSGQPLDYAEYLDAGSRSIAVMNILVTAALLLDLEPARRLADPGASEAVRHLCLLARLENDLNSYERDRSEGGLANAILVLERTLGPGARPFVEREQEAYKRLLARSLERLGPEDGFAGLLRRARDCHASYYDAFRKQRYDAGG